MYIIFYRMRGFIMVKNYKFDARKKDNAWQLILSYKDKRGKWHQKSQQGV